MHKITGWLIDLYAAPEGGIKLWVICKNGERLCLRKNFAVTFYASGDFSTLRRAWVYLRDKNVSLTRTRRRDLFTGERDVLAVTAWVRSLATFEGMVGVLYVALLMGG